MKLTGDLKEMGIEQSHADPCAFHNFVTRQLVAIFVIYVDDLLAFTTTPKIMESFLGDLRSWYKIKYLGEASYYMRSLTLPTNVRNGS